MITIRASSLPGYNDCPRRAAARSWSDIVGVKHSERRKIYTAIGDGCHAGAAAMARRKITETPTLDEGQTVALQICRDAALQGVEFDETTHNINAAEKQVLRMVLSFHDAILPDLAPKEIEIRRIATIDDRFRLSGMLDLESDGGVIRDWKFGHVYRSCKAQLGAYSLLRKSHVHQPTCSLIGNHIPRVAIKKPQPSPEKKDYAVESAEREALEIIQTMIRDITAYEKSGNPAAFPANPMSMLCNPKYCAVYNTKWCSACQ